MNINGWIYPGLFLCVLLFSALPATAMTNEQKRMLDQLDQLDRLEFSEHEEKANACIRARDFGCAEKKLADAAKFVSSSRDKDILQELHQKLAAERRVAQEEARRREEEAERERQEARRREEEDERERRRQAEREADEESPSTAAMFGAVLNTFATTYNQQTARDQQIRDDFNAGIARAREKGEAERRRKEEAATKVEAERQYRAQQQAAQAQQAYQAQARADNEAAARQAEVVRGSQSSQNSRTASSGTTGVWTPPPTSQSKRDCRYEHKEGPVGGLWLKDKDRAEADMRDSARSYCINLGGYKLSDESCESKPIREPVFKDGKMTIKEVGTQWQCRGVASCNNIREICKEKTSGASQQ